MIPIRIVSFRTGKMYSVVRVQTVDIARNDDCNWLSASDDYRYDQDCFVNIIKSDLIIYFPRSKSSDRHYKYQYCNGASVQNSISVRSFFPICRLLWLFNIIYTGIYLTFHFHCRIAILRFRNTSNEPLSILAIIHYFINADCFMNQQYMFVHAYL